MRRRHPGAVGSILQDVGHFALGVAAGLARFAAFVAAVAALATVLAAV